MTQVFKNYSLIFLIKFHSNMKLDGDARWKKKWKKGQNKLNFTCQNRHYSNAPAAESWVSVAVNNQAKRKLKLTTWRMFHHSQYFIGFCFWLLSFNLPLPLKTLFDRLSFHCRWVEMKSFKRLLQSWWNIPSLFFYRFMSVDALSENNFTAFLCQKLERVKLRHEEDKSK